jgi:glycine/D-amino acid oxidase-like deaminating enzyme
VFDELERRFAALPVDEGERVDDLVVDEGQDFNAAWVEPLLARGARFVPAIAGAPIRGAHACARPRSQDGRPLLGRVPGFDDLCVCAGHGPWGISTGPATARIVADLILGRPTPIPPQVGAARDGSPRSAGVASGI